MRQWCGLLTLAVAAMSWSACAASSSTGGQHDRVLFLLGEEFDPQEFWGPYSVLSAAGYRVDLAGAEKGVQLTPDTNLPEANIRTTIGLDEVKVSDYLALVVPGGPSGANVARFPRARQIAREFDSAGKPIGTVCHGARLLMPEGIFKGRRTTFVFMVADELADQWKAGDYGMYLDLPVVIDRNLISSRDPRDVPVWAGVLRDRLAESGGLTVDPREGKVSIVLPGATEHQKWVLDRLNTFGLSPVVWAEIPLQDIIPDVQTASDMLVILDGVGVKQLNSSTSFASMVDAFGRSGKAILVAETARKSLPAIDLSKARVIQGDDIAQVMRQIVESASSAESARKAVTPDTAQWAARYAAAIARPITGVPWDPDVAYDAVLALWYGYDDDAAARMSEFLARSGRRVLVLGPHKGVLPGLNGGKADIGATYDDQVELSARAIVVAPGGVWPKKTKAQQAVQPQWVETDEPARQQRLAWLTRQYTSGRMLVAFGFDSLYLGQQALFKGKHFASTDQASVIWFGSNGAQYSPANAMLSDDNLITAKPLVGVDDAIRLLRQISQEQ